MRGEHELDKMLVPRSRVSDTHQALRDDIVAAVEPILFGRLPSEGKGESLERAFAEVVEQRYACGVHSGTVGLFLALRGCGVGPGDEVITVGNSDISTTAAISHCGARPVLCDVKATDYTMDPELIEPLITEQTTALLPVDLYGHPADVKSLREIADRYDLRIVEDAALATGAEDHGRPVGAFADVTVFSFAPFKPLGCVGNGGIVTTNREGIARRVRLLCGYGHMPDRHAETPGHQMHIGEGYNVPLDPVQAALVATKLPYLGEWTEKRRRIAASYEDGLRPLAVQLPTFRSESQPTFRSYTVLVEDQQAVYQGLRAAGVEAVLHYAPPIYEQPVYQDGGVRRGTTPVTEVLARKLVCLPVAAELNEADIEYVIDTLRELL